MIVPAEAIANILEVITIGKDYLVVRTLLLPPPVLSVTSARYRS